MRDRLLSHVRISTCISLMIVAAFNSTASADGILRNGVGAISTGRGGTNLAFADNGNIILDNPGGLVNIPGRGLAEAGFDVFFPDFAYADPDNAWVSSANNPFPMGQLSVIGKSADGIFAWGLGAFSHAGFSSQYELQGPWPLAGPQNYKSVGALLRVLPSLSVALTPNWSVGGTLGVAVSHMELEGPYFTQSPTPFQGTPMLMDLQGTGAGLSWSVGTQYLLSDSTTLGASFQAKTSIKTDGSAQLIIPGLGYSAFDLDIEAQWPSVFGIGIAHQHSPHTQVAAEALWTQWANSSQSFPMLLSNPTSPIYQSVLGNALPEEFPLRWRNSVAVRLGMQHTTAGGHILRGGYACHPNSIPDQTLTPFIQATIEHSLSCGYGWRTAGYGLDFGYQYMFGADRQVAHSDFLGGDFDGAQSSASAHWLLASLIRHF